MIICGIDIQFNIFKHVIRKKIKTSVDILVSPATLKINFKGHSTSPKVIQLPC